MSEPDKDNLIALLAASRSGKPALERRLGELALGIIISLRSGQLSIERAWDELFNLENYRAARRRKLSPSIFELFELGMELENVAEIAPASVAESLNRMQQLAQRIIGAASVTRGRLRKSA